LGVFSQPDGFGLAEGGEFEILMFKFTIMFNRIQNAQPCYSAPLLASIYVKAVSSKKLQS